MIKTKTIKQLRANRVRRVRAKIHGTSARPRLSVYKSNAAMYVQLIDDDAGKVLTSHKITGKNIAAGSALGREIAKIAKAKKITVVVFDRGGYRYHGAVKALAEAVREGGITV